MLVLPVLFVFVTLGSALDFDCTTLVPNGRMASDEEADLPFVTHVDTTKVYSAGDIVKVKVSSSQQTFNKFAIQARQPLADVALGEFRLDRDDTVQRLASCGNEGDTLTNRGSQAIQEVSAKWVVPRGLANIQNIEFDIAVSSGRKFWIFNTQMISLNVQKSSNQASQQMSGASDARVEEELTIRKEELLRKQIEEEDAYSEGDWQEEKEEKKRRHEEEIMKEEIQSQELKAQVERERIDHIQYEMEDKEEHDRVKAMKVDKAIGGKVEGDVGLGDMIGRQLG